jgi:hypothetical protein
MHIKKIPQVIVTVLATTIVTTILSLDATAQTLNGVKIGSSPSTLEALQLQPIAREGRGDIKITKFKLSSGNLLSVTYDTRVDKILYIETDWNEMPNARTTGLPGLAFGATTLDDIRRKNGSNGFTWQRMGVQRDGDRLITFNAYEVRQKPGSIVVFVNMLNISEYKAAGSDEKQMSSFLKLHAVILANERYLDQIWGEAKVYDGTSQPIRWQD